LRALAPTGFPASPVLSGFSGALSSGGPWPPDRESVPFPGTVAPPAPGPETPRADRAGDPCRSPRRYRSEDTPPWCRPAWPVHSRPGVLLSDCALPASSITTPPPAPACTWRATSASASPPPPCPARPTAPCPDARSSVPHAGADRRLGIFSSDSAAPRTTARCPAYSIFFQQARTVVLAPSFNRSSAGEKDPPARRAAAGGTLVVHRPTPRPHLPPLHLRFSGEGHSTIRPQIGQGTSTPGSARSSAPDVLPAVSGSAHRPTRRPGLHAAQT